MNNAEVFYLDKYLHPDVKHSQNQNIWLCRFLDNFVANCGYDTI